MASRHPPPAGAGRLVGELAGTVVTVRERPPGTFTVIDTSPANPPRTRLPRIWPRIWSSHRTAADCTCSNRGPDCLTAFTFEGPVPLPVADHPGGSWPRHFAVLDGHCYVTAQSDDEVVSFALPASTGKAGVITWYPVGSPSRAVACSLIP